MRGISGPGQHRLIRGDRKQGSKFAAWQLTTGGHLHREVLQRHAHGVEERLDRHRGVVVEQDDEFLADMDERHLFIGDTRQVELGLLLIAEFDGNRLPVQGLSSP